MSMSEHEDLYLGDSVYVTRIDGMIKLYTHNGFPDDPRNVIFLEPSVLKAFLRFATGKDL